MKKRARQCLPRFLWRGRHFETYESLGSSPMKMSQAFHDPSICFNFLYFHRKVNTSTSSPGPSPRRFSKWRIVGRRPWQRLDHVVQNLQKSWRFLSRDILRKAFRRSAILKIVEEKALGTRLVNTVKTPEMCLYLDSDV